MTRRIRRMLALAVSGLLLVTASAVGGVSAADTGTENGSELLVKLQPDGDATVSLTLTYDLAEEDGQTSFAHLEENATAVSEQFHKRLSRIADRTADETDREMTVSDVSATLSVDNGTGVVRLSSSWSNLAATDGDQLVVNEPFASQFQPDRPFVLATPDNYTVTDTEIPVDSGGTHTAEWDAGADLSGLSVTVAPTEGESDEKKTGTGGLDPLPGSLVVATIVSVLGYGVWRQR